MTRLTAFPTATLLLGAFAITGALALGASLLPSFVLVRAPAVSANTKINEDIALPVLAVADYSEIEKRPLFNPGRQKDAPKVAAGTQPLPPLSAYRLVGIVTRSDLSIALVARTTSSEVLYLKAGDDLDGRLVFKIVPGAVQLGTTGQERIVFPKAADAASSNLDALATNSQ